MSKFKIGDKVKIIECLCESVRVRYINKIATITKTTENNEYEIDLDNGKYFWYPFEFELYEKQPNEYTITDLLNNFPFETEFEYMERKYKMSNGNLLVDDSIYGWIESIMSFKEILNMKFTKIEEPKLKPMTFEGAVRTGNKIKFKYSDNYNMAKGFLPFNDAIYFLTTPYFDNNVIRKLILEGTWFAEGVYE